MIFSISFCSDFGRSTCGCCRIEQFVLFIRNPFSRHKHAPSFLFIMFEDADLSDLFRGGIPYYLLIALPILIICSSNPVLASNEFSIQRMSQYDLHGVSYG